MKLSRFITLAAAPVMTAAIAMVAVAGAGAAQAANPLPLCIDNSSTCAYAHGANAVEMISRRSDTTNWTYPSAAPNSSGTLVPAEIQQAGTTQCMQVDNADGNIVREAKCIGDPAEEWYNEGSVGGFNIFVSKWNQNLCLTYDETGTTGTGILKVGGCGAQWYQLFSN